MNLYGAPAVTVMSCQQCVAELATTPGLHLDYAIINAGVLKYPNVRQTSREAVHRRSADRARSEQQTCKLTRRATNTSSTDRPRQQELRAVRLPPQHQHHRPHHLRPAASQIQHHRRQHHLHLLRLGLAQCVPRPRRRFRRLLCVQSCSQHHRQTHGCRAQATGREDHAAAAASR